MPIPVPSDRAVYSNSGRVRINSLVWGAATGAFLSLVVSAAMMGLGWIGFYFIIMVPAAAGMAVGGLANLVVYQSHCRNWMLAGALGFFMGVMAYLGYYHLDMLTHVGFQNWHRVDVLPAFIEIRWQNDVIGKPGQNGGAPGYVMNMLLFLFEGGMMACIAAAIAKNAGSKPYAETARSWMNKVLFRCPAGSSGPIAEALAARSTTNLAAVLVPSQNDDAGYNQCELWHCPPHLDPDREEPIYLSMSELGPPNKDGQRATVPVVSLWQLDAAELAVVGKAFPAEMAIVYGLFDAAEPDGDAPAAPAADAPGEAT